MVLSRESRIVCREIVARWRIPDCERALLANRQKNRCEVAHAFGTVEGMCLSIFSPYDTSTYTISVSLSLSLFCFLLDSFREVDRRRRRNKRGSGLFWRLRNSYRYTNNKSIIYGKKYFGSVEKNGYRLKRHCE